MLRKSLCIPTLFVDGLSQGKPHKKIFPESPSSRSHAFLIQINCAMLEKLSPRTNEIVRNKGKSKSKGSQREVTVSREIFNIDSYFITKVPQFIIVCRIITQNNCVFLNEKYNLSEYYTFITFFSMVNIYKT